METRPHRFEAWGLFICKHCGKPCDDKIHNATILASSLRARDRRQQEKLVDAPMKESRRR